MEPGPNADLRSQLERLWALSTGGSDSGGVWKALDEGYAAPGRAYHNWTHIAAMLSGLAVARREDEFFSIAFDDVELAIFFHDAIYDPQRSDNEARSAELFRQSVGDRMDASAIDRIANMILATKAHGPTDDPATRLLLDLDLSVLGGSPQAYRRYVDAVRTEYAAIPDELWRTGRAAVLRHFLERERIYQTQVFAGLEAPARTNLNNEIAELT